MADESVEALQRLPIGRVWMLSAKHAAEINENRSELRAFDKARTGVIFGSWSRDLWVGLDRFAAARCGRQRERFSFF
jgi:hypothetical protein